MSSGSEIEIAWKLVKGFMLTHFVVISVFFAVVVSFVGGGEFRGIFDIR